MGRLLSKTGIENRCGILKIELATILENGGGKMFSFLINTKLRKVPYLIKVLFLFVG